MNKLRTKIATATLTVCMLFAWQTNATAGNKFPTLSAKDGAVATTAINPSRADDCIEQRIELSDGWVIETYYFKKTGYIYSLVYNPYTNEWTFYNNQ